MPPGVSQTTGFPPVYTDWEGFEKVLNSPLMAQGVGLDLEFNSSTLRPSILGIANREEAAAIPWDSDLARACVRRTEDLGTQIVGHSVIGADRPVLEKALGFRTPLALWDDTIIRHYLCNPQLCKTPSKEEDESDGGGSGAMGFMNLWAMGSLYTDLPQWKVCRGKACDGPCPLHRPFEYCAIDAWAGLEAKYGTAAEMARKGIPEKLHQDLSRLTDICVRMEDQGICIDREYVRSLEENFDVLKAELFPPEAPFNPRSPTQIKAYFEARGIGLPETDKKTLSKVLEKEAKRRGFALVDLEYAETLPPELEWLFKLFQFKESGKGLKSWFDDKYIDRDGLIHPRFIVTGSSMGRLASSRPNFTNIPARGFGAKVKPAIIPRDPSLDLVKADFSQLEMRIMLHYGGFVLKDLAGDPFAGLVERSRGQFKPAAAFLHGKERDVAKVLVHAGNYGEGVIVLSGKDLEKRKAEIDFGALRVYRDWEYRGGVVGFTGANLAERLFGNKTRESRKAALELQELVFDEFPWIRNTQRSVCRQIEEKRGVQLETGRFLPLFGSPEDDFKMGTAAVGQGGGADHMQSVMLRFDEETGRIPLLVVHDEATFEIPKAWPNSQALEFIKLMEEPTSRMEGFWCKAPAKRGPNWGTMESIG